MVKNFLRPFGCPDQKHEALNKTIILNKKKTTYKNFYKWLEFKVASKLFIYIPTINRNTSLND